MILYRFFPDHEYVIESLKKRRLKISTLEDLNDEPFEFLACSLSDPTLRQAMTETRSMLWKNKGIICFSEIFHDPLMWAHYGNGHKGICMGFEIKDSVKECINKVSYVSERIRWDENIDEELMSQIINSKYINWEYEREVRLSFSLTDSDQGMYFVNFEDLGILKEIILGMRSKLSKETLAEVLDDIYPPVEIFRAVPDTDHFRFCKILLD